jgi:6 kDa early secretory antigenic target
MAGFKVTPAELEAGESKMRGVAGHIASELAAAKAAVARLASGWEGDARGRFNEYMLEWNRLADSQQRNFDDVAKSLGVAAKNDQGAEDSAKTSFTPN